MPDLDQQFQFVHLRDTGNFNINVGLEVSAVLFVGNERLHLISKKLNVLQSRCKIDEYLQPLPHSFRSRDILYPLGVEHNVRNLSSLMSSYVLENSVQEGDVLDHELTIADIYSVKHVKWVFYEEKDAGAQDFLC